MFGKDMAGLGKDKIGFGLVKVGYYYDQGWVWLE